MTAWKDIHDVEADPAEKIAAAKNEWVRILEARKVGTFVPKINKMRAVKMVCLWTPKEEMVLRLYCMPQQSVFER